MRRGKTDRELSQVLTNICPFLVLEVMQSNPKSAKLSLQPTVNLKTELFVKTGQFY